MKLSIYCAEKYNISKRKAKELIKNGNIFIDKSIIKKDIEINGDENISINLNKSDVIYNLDDYLLYKDDDYIFLYKPPFIHSERLYFDDNLTISDIYKNFLEYKPLSRLDFEADGIIGMISNDIPINNLSKSYYAFVEGYFPNEITLSKKIDARKKQKVKVIDEDNSGFKTHMKRVGYKNNISLIEVTLEKAARHQVRAFCSYLSHPIIGDKLYNGKPYERLCLHSFKYTINNKTYYCKEQTKNFLGMFM